MKILGNVTREQAELYTSLIIEGRLPLSNEGGACQVSFNSGEAIKHPYERDAANPRIRRDAEQILEDEYILSSSLSEGGFYVPRVRGVVLDSELPMLIMERKKLTPYSQLDRTEKQVFKRQFDEVVPRFKRKGFVPGDMDRTYNCGWDREKQLICFFDFGGYKIGNSWRGN